MRQIQRYGKTVAYDEEGKPVFLTDVRDVERFIKVPASVITKAMPQNIKKYHKKAPPPQKKNYEVQYEM